MKKTRTLKAQSISEYSICVAGIILAVIVMQIYVRRGLQGRYADVVDFATTKAQARQQYEPYYLNEDFTTAKNTSIQENNQRRGWRRNDILQDDTTRSGTSVEGINCYDDK